ncbi:MAG: hypothetical protein CO064_09090 [Anaerolineae bacterium CG_4_9_14_0_8_um_filter_58_9]|nr:MAG: hypothetical protein CO064_09090 [Anaerolineae bacterium CG_4_9_14_0_8_um_filter_58_9]
MPRQIQIQNQNRALEQLLSVGYCESFFCRLRGLTFRHRLAPDEGLLLVQRRESRLDAAIHMLAVFTDLAVIWINADYTVVDTLHAKAWHLAYFPKRPAKYILEIHPKRITDFKIGDKVTFINE